MNNPQTGRFERHARDLYLRAGPSVDAGTAARLRAARRTTLDSRAPSHRLRWMVPAGAFAVAALAVFTVWQPLRGPAPMAPAASTTAAANTDAAQALPPDADQADPALYQNLDFYTWLAQQPAATQAPPGP